MSSRRRELVERIRPPRPLDDLRRPAARLAIDLLVYAALWAALLLSSSWWWKAALGVGAGIAIARLILMGHDACHGAFFPAARRANALAGRIVFLPSLTPYSTWELGHNTLHHGFTNLRGKDYVYTPLSKAEFDALPAWRKLVERAYRHPFGPGLHYGIEVWWRRLWFPRRPPGDGSRRAAYFSDSLLTLGYLVAQVCIVAAVARSTGQHPAALAAWAIALPFAVWSFVMGFVTYQQHTHTRVVWYADRREWDPVTAQVQGTVHILFPAPIGALLGNIMDTRRITWMWRFRCSICRRHNGAWSMSLPRT